MHDGFVALYICFCHSSSRAVVYSICGTYYLLSILQEQVDTIPIEGGILSRQKAKCASTMKHL